MSEMLGNQYFLSRKYALALPQLERALEKDPGNKKIQRKIIICCTQMGNVPRALEVFTSLIKEDIDFIIHTDPISHDCPCPELVYDLAGKEDENQRSVDFQIISGILWLFCDIRKSLCYFQNAQKLEKNNPVLNFIMIKLTSRLEEEKVR